MSIYNSVTENIYTNSIYFSAITCETTLVGLIHSDQKHIDVGLTHTVLPGYIGFYAENLNGVVRVFSLCQATHLHVEKQLGT